MGVYPLIEPRREEMGLPWERFSLRRVLEAMTSILVCVCAAAIPITMGLLSAFGPT
jgi:hypothetical protein